MTGGFSGWCGGDDGRREEGDEGGSIHDW
nr:hypothetical protein [Tanacetum cinerariifolium]